MARQLSDQDVAEIERIVSGSGGKPWLLNGPRGQIADLRYVDAYLPPEIATPQFRRGSLVTVLNGSARGLALVGIRPASPPTLQPAWIVMRTESYAQVAIARRGYDQIEGDQDVNRPFRVLGRFEDLDLVSLVRSVRSSPIGPTPGAATPRGSVHGDWPILAVVRETESIVIRLRRDDFASEHVRLRRQGPEWLVIAITMFFA